MGQLQRTVASWAEDGGSPAPTYSQWQRLWQLWDTVTLEMLPPGCHTAQPLALRHPFIFYLGHLPAFSDARLARVLQQELTEPQHFAVTFARGIDPDLEDPTRCHAHSAVPAKWPELPHILQYRDSVRQRIAQLYADSNSNSRSPAPAAAGGHQTAANCVAAAAAVAAMPGTLQHVLWLCYEHEAMHLETLLYMMVQYDRTAPPPADMLKPQYLAAAAAAVKSDESSRGSNDSSAAQQEAGGGCDAGADAGAAAAAVKGAGARHECLQPPPAAQLVLLPGGMVRQGFDAAGWQQQPAEADGTMAGSTAARSVAAAAAAAPVTAAVDTPQSAAQQPMLLRFGWDNEMPARTAEVAGCVMQHRPVCVLEYLWFLAHKLAMAVGTAGGRHDAVGAAGASSSSSHGLVQLMSPGGSLQGLLPLSLQLDKADSGKAAAQDPLSDASSVAHSSSSNSSSSSSDSSTTTTQQHIFEVLQQRLFVKSVYGPVAVREAGQWPIYCSALQAEAYAAWWDGGSCRLPTEGELLLARQYNEDVIRQYSSSNSSSSSSSSSGRSSTETELLLARQYTEDEVRQYSGDEARRDRAAAGGQYSNDGDSVSDAAELAAVDFNVWHPVDVQLLPPTPGNQHVQLRDTPVAAAADALPLFSQLADNGWEWSSTVFAAHAGFQPHMLYPEYSADFFDGKHLVLLGGSWATLGSIAGRASFRNWYQAGQQHVFAKFRLCRSS